MLHAFKDTNWHPGLALNSTKACTRLREVYTELHKEIKCPASRLQLTEKLLSHLTSDRIGPVRDPLLCMATADPTAV